MIYLLGLSLVVLLVVFALPIIVEQVTDISRDFPTYYGSLRSALFHSPSRILALVAVQLPSGIRMLTLNITVSCWRAIDPGHKIFLLRWLIRQARLH